VVGKTYPLLIQATKQPITLFAASLLLRYFKIDILITNDPTSTPVMTIKNTPQSTYSEMYDFNKNFFFAAATLEHFTKINTVIVTQWDFICSQLKQIV
jgi:hypothetical protein